MGPWACVVPERVFFRLLCWVVCWGGFVRGLFHLDMCDDTRKGRELNVLNREHTGSRSVLYRKYRHDEIRGRNGNGKVGRSVRLRTRLRTSRRID